jgi:hypothetical protein
VAVAVAVVEQAHSSIRTTTTLAVIILSCKQVIAVTAAEVVAVAQVALQARQVETVTVTVIGMTLTAVTRSQVAVAH